MTSAEKIGASSIGQSEVGWATSLTGQPAGQPDPKKPTALREAAGAWDRKSGDRIRAATVNASTLLTFSAEAGS